MQHIKDDYARFKSPDDEIHQEMINNFVVYSEEGNKYIKVVIKAGQFISVHSFVVKQNGKFKEGDILKAASWKSPATNYIRGNINSNTGYHAIKWMGC